MSRVVLLALALAACSPTYYGGARVWNSQTASGQRQRVSTCPTVTMLFGDFVLAAAALGIAALKVNSGQTGEAIAYSGTGGALLLGANMAEVACRP